MKIKGIFKAVLTVTFIGVLTRLASFIFRVYLSRKLGAEILGLYQIATSIFMLFLCVTTSGLPTTLSRKTAQYDTIADHDHAKRIFSMAMVTAICISVIFCLVFSIFPNILDLFFTDKRCKDIFLILLPSLISTSVYCIIRAWFWGKKQYFIYSSTEFLEEIIKIILTATFITLPFFANKLGQGVALAYVVGDIMVAIFLIALFFKKGGRMPKPLYFKELMKSASPLTGTRIYASLISSALALLLPSLLVKYGMTTPEATADFGRMSGMVMPLILAPGAVVGALAVVLVPELATTNASKDYSSAHSKIKRSMLLSVAITAICMTTFLSCGQEIGILLYNDSRAGKLLVSSCILMIPLVLNQFTVTALNSLAQENWTFITHIIGSIVLVVLLLILPKYVGVMTYVYSLVGFHSTNLILNTLRLKKVTSIKLDYLFDCGIMAAAALLTALIGKAVNSACRGMSLLGNIICSTLSSCALLGVIIAAIYFTIYKPKPWLYFGIKKSD